MCTSFESPRNVKSEEMKKKLNLIAVFSIFIIVFSTSAQNASETSTSPTDENYCPISCDGIDEPICCFDKESGVKINAGSECFMRKFNCEHRTNFQKISDGNCPIPWPFTTASGETNEPESEEVESTTYWDELVWTAQ